MAKQLLVNYISKKKKENRMITAENVMAIGTASGTDINLKNSHELKQLQAIINLTDVLKLMTVVLIDIRDREQAKHWPEK